MTPHEKEAMPQESLEILLVEDNPGDIRLTQEVFRECRVHNRLQVVQDGEEAMTFLKREGPYTQARRPHLILLDMNLPRKAGREVLAEIKKDPDLRRIPVVILTTSQTPDDITLAYDLHANCYLSKPVELDRFLRVVQSIGDFWLGIADLPAR